MENKGYKKLIVWQKADELAYIKSTSDKSTSAPVITYTLCACAPTLSFVALGSLAETEYLLDFSLRLKYLKQQQHEGLQNLRQEVGNLLWKFYKSL